MPAARHTSMCGLLPAPPLRTPCCGNPRRPSRGARGPSDPSARRDASRKDARNRDSWSRSIESGRTRNARCGIPAGADRRPLRCFPRRCTRRQRGNLRGIQIVRRREARQPEFEIRRGGDRVGGIQAEIADQSVDADARASAFSMPRRAHQNRAFQARAGNSRIRSSPGFSTRGAGHARQRCRCAFTRSIEGRRPYRSR